MGTGAGTLTQGSRSNLPKGEGMSASTSWMENASMETDAGMITPQPDWGEGASGITSEVRAVT